MLESAKSMGNEIVTITLAGVIGNIFKYSQNSSLVK